MGRLNPAARLYYLEQVDSTNNWAKAHLAGLAHLDAVYAASQTAGKGRLGRSWQNAGQEGLYYTIVCKAPLADPASLPLLASLAAAGALKELFGLCCQIKWPNDLLAGGKKLCGILCEATPEGIVCGIGVNLWQSEEFFAARGLPHATSAAAALAAQRADGEKGPGVPQDTSAPQNMGHAPDADAPPPGIGKAPDAGRAQNPQAGTLPPNAARLLAEGISARFAALLPPFAQNGFGALRQEYCRHCVNLGREVEFAGGRGIARDIDEQGRLLVETGAGETAVFTGEVSVRGIYGRV